MWLFLIAVHAPAAALGGNRFGFLAPSILILCLLTTAMASRLRPPVYVSWLWLGVIAWGALLWCSAGVLAVVLCTACFGT